MQAKWRIITALVVIFVFYYYQLNLIVKAYHHWRSLSAEIETIEVSIPEKEYRTVDSLRSDVLLHRKITKAHKNYVDATIRYNVELLEAKARLKGDRLDHYQTIPPSFRIKVLEDKKVLGTNKFSLQSLDARNFPREWIFLKLLEYQDILAVNSDVVELQINGNKTICTFEEHFTHHLTDRYHRPVGPIVCVSEDLFWEYRIQKDSAKSTTEQDIYFNSPLKSYNMSASLDSIDEEKALTLLNEFRIGNKDVTEIFDIDRLAKYFAIADLTNTHHGLRWHNRKYYYNPLSERLEPIGFDGSSWKKLSKFVFEKEQMLHFDVVPLTSNKEFVELYLLQLSEMSKAEFLDGFFDHYEKEITELENRIYLHDLTFSNIDGFVYDNANWINENIGSYKSSLVENLDSIASTTARLAPN